MLNIQKGVFNILTVTLTEKCEVNNPYYLFNFKHKTTGQSVSFYLTDTSGFPERFNEFGFTEGTGTKILEIGMHDYTIYAKTSSANLLPGDELERGIAMVTDSVSAYTEHDPETNYKQHNI